MYNIEYRNGKKYFVMIQVLGELNLCLPACELCTYEVADEKYNEVWFCNNCLDEAKKKHKLQTYVGELVCQ